MYIAYCFNVKYIMDYLELGNYHFCDTNNIFFIETFFTV